MIASDVMVRDVKTVAPGTSVAEAARLMAQNDISALPVVDDHGQLVGEWIFGSVTRQLPPSSPGCCLMSN